MCFVVTKLRTGNWDLVELCNGVLCGFVAITAGAHVVEPWAAILDGAAGALVFTGVCWLFLKFKIDDPLAAAPMHGFAGAWGVFFVGLLAKEEYVLQNYSPTEEYTYGLFYGGGGRLLACQVIGILAIGAWVIGLASILFGTLKFFGMIRISHDEELMGLDASKHGQSAPDEAMVRVAQKEDRGEAIAESIETRRMGSNRVTAWAEPV